MTMTSSEILSSSTMDQLNRRYDEILRGLNGGEVGLIVTAASDLAKYAIDLALMCERSATRGEQ